MTLPPLGPDQHDGVHGVSYCGLFANAEHERVLRFLAERRFTGWLGPQEGDWVLAVAERQQGAVAGDGTSLLTLGSELAHTLATVVLAVRVERDRVLRIDGWRGVQHDETEDVAVLGGYLSDPSADAAEDEDVYPEPQGAHFAADYAQACGVPAAADELHEVLAEELDPESVIESERLDSVLRLLDLPRWLVSADSLPGDVPAGPRRSELTRLGAGREGLGGRVAGTLTGVLRKRRRPG